MSAQGLGFESEGERKVYLLTQAENVRQMIRGMNVKHLPPQQRALMKQAMRLQEDIIRLLSWEIIEQ